MSPVKYELGFYIPEDAILHRLQEEGMKHESNKSEAEEEEGVSLPSGLGCLRVGLLY
jgi:hypothetical protein